MMKAGPELDVKMATEVMRWTPDGEYWWKGRRCTGHRLGWSPSTYWGEAGDVVAEITARGYHFDLWFADAWLSRFAQPDEAVQWECGDTGPHAICLAALAAKGIAS